jgi:hypothetical protein
MATGKMRDPLGLDDDLAVRGVEAEAYFAQAFAEHDMAQAYLVLGIEDKEAAAAADASRSAAAESKP